MPPTRKPRERRQRRGTDELNETSAVPAEVVDSPPPVKIPPAEKGWLSATATDWREFWRSDLARHINATDRPALKRLFRLRDQLVRAQRREAELRKLAMAEPIVDGSMGQKVANPMFRMADSATAEALAIEPRIVALEDRLGLTPRARLNLGVAEQQGLNLLGQNQLIAGQIVGGSNAPDPRAVPGDTATPPR